MDLLKTLFIFVMLTYPLGEIIRFQLNSGVAFTLNTFFVALTAGFWLLQVFFRKKNKQNLQSPITKPLFIFIIIAFLSLFMNLNNLTFSQAFISSLYLVRWILYALMFFVVLNFDHIFKQTIKNSLIIMGTIIVFVGFVQYFFYPSLNSFFYLGWDEHMYRMFSTFLDPNYLGAFLVLFSLFILSHFLKNPSIIYGLLFFLTIIAVLLTFSRSAILMLLVSLILYLTLLGKGKYLVLFFTVLLFFFLFSSRYFHIENINPFRIVSTEARLETARNAITIFKKNPVLGIGFNAYKYAQIKYGFRKEINASKSHADASPDNSFLFILAATGILGFFTYLNLWVNILKNATLLILASTIGLFINSMFINSMFYPFIMLWLWIILGLQEKNIKESR